ncbi:MAG: choice-of-anchor E domain-containing protein [Planctomycetes bacterium]|jgi:hypothetical protein|nr:choice-of-anchor E domain-containing protein [Planctomycetota bacterium]
MKLASIIAAIAIILTLAAVGQAAPLQTETETYGPQSPTFSDTLNFNQYSGGDCGLVRITLHAASSGGSVSLDNEGESSAVASYDFGIRSTLSSTTFSPDVVLNALNSGSENLAADDGDDPETVQTDAPDGAFITGSNVSDGDVLEFTGTDMDPFLGSSTFDILASVDSIATITGGVNFTNIVSQGDGYATVEYFVPEPATVGLLTIGGLGLLLRRRRRNARA